MDIHNIKKEFPIFDHEPELVYLDSASTTLTPRVVVDAMDYYYTHCPVNIRRGMYALSEQANDMVDESRKKIADFIHAETQEIIFTSGTTQSLNLLARMLESSVKQKNNIVLTRLEHHANLIPWQQLAKRVGAEIRFIELTDDGHLNMHSAHQLIDEQTAIVSVSLISNVLGSLAPVKDLIALTKQSGAFSVVDAAQAVGHLSIDIRELDCDFLAFSGHKMYGPKGVGVLYGNKELLESLEPVHFGGDMVREVTYEAATWAELPNKFEAGTQNIPAIIGLGAAVTFVESLGWNDIQNQEKKNVIYALDTLQKIEKIKIVGPKNGQHRSGIISFMIDKVHPHDVSEVFNSQRIAVRAGHHCAMPLLRMLGLSGTVRLSLGIYSSQDDIDRAILAIQKTFQLFH